MIFFVEFSAQTWTIIDDKFRGKKNEMIFAPCGKLSCDNFDN